MRLQGKVAVVTGGGAGIGRGIVLCMAKEGADIAIPDIQDANAQSVAKEVLALGGVVHQDVDLAQLFLDPMPHMMERKSGRIINIASIAGPLAAQTMPPYSVAKGGVITFTRVLAKDLAAHGITVNAICPGVLWTAFWENLAQYIADTNPAFKGMTARQVFDKRINDVIPLKREQTPEDIGWAATFLASEEARNITGQALNVDGGSVMH